MFAIVTEKFGESFVVDGEIIDNAKNRAPRDHFSNFQPLSLASRQVVVSRVHLVERIEEADDERDAEPIRLVTRSGDGDVEEDVYASISGITLPSWHSGTGRLSRSFRVELGLMPIR